MATNTYQELQKVLQALIFGVCDKAYWAGYEIDQDGKKAYHYDLVTTDIDIYYARMNELRKFHEAKLGTLENLEELFPLVDKIYQSGKGMIFFKTNDDNGEFFNYWFEMKQEYEKLKEYKKGNHKLQGYLTKPGNRLDFWMTGTINHYDIILSGDKFHETMEERKAAHEENIEAIRFLEEQLPLFKEVYLSGMVKADYINEGDEEENNNFKHYYFNLQSLYENIKRYGISLLE